MLVAQRREFYNLNSARNARQNLVEMFSREDVLRSAMFVAIGGILAVVVLKLLEKKETGDDDLNEPPRPKESKVAQEHDERFC